MKHWVEVAKKFFYQGKIKEAKKLFLKVHSKYPNQPDALNYLSIIAYQEGDYIKARQYVETFLRKYPNDTIFLNRLGQIHFVQEKYKSAENTLLYALRRNPDSVELHYNLGRVYYKMKVINKSILEFQRVIQLNPDHEKAQKYLNNLESHRYKSSPENLESAELLSQGLALLKKGNYNKALPIFVQLHKSHPDHYVVYYNLGLIYFLLNQYLKAIPLLWEAKLLGGSKVIVPFLYYVYAKISICDWTDYKKNVQELKKLTEEYLIDKPDFQIPVYILNYFAIPRNLISESGWHQSNLISDLYPQKYTHHPTKKTDRNERIKIGYISTKFRISPGGVLLHNVFQYHDRAQFEVFGYSLKKLDFNDYFTKQFNNSFDVLKDISSYSDQEAAHLIHGDHIDVLISLAGYDGEMRLGVLAQQPAPIQMNWAGYHESIGSDFIQYSILDKSLNSKDTGTFFKEKILELPGCGLFNSPLKAMGAVSRNDYDIPENTFVYTCQNHPKKITLQEIRIWSQILERNQNSILWIYDGGIEQVRNNLKKAFIERNIDKERIIFCTQEEINKFWKRLEIADVFLDTFIYNAHVTAIEALHAGIPVLTIEGKSNYSKLGSSILRAAGLSELICKTEDEYIEKAVDIAMNGKIQDLKNKILLSKDSEILFNPEKNIQNLEKAILEVVNK